LTILIGVALFYSINISLFASKPSQVVSIIALRQNKRDFHTIHTTSDQVASKIKDQR
jgi:hypothetical protein